MTATVAPPPDAQEPAGAGQVSAGAMDVPGPGPTPDRCGSGRPAARFRSTGWQRDNQSGGAGDGGQDAVEPAGAAGRTNFLNFLSPGAPSSSGGDTFAAKLDPGALLHGAYLDGSSYDAARASALGPSSRSRAVSACPFINSASAIAAMVGAICRSPSAVTV